jgi:iron complex outermembrane receptor protein
MTARSIRPAAPSRRLLALLLLSTAAPALAQTADTPPPPSPGQQTGEPVAGAPGTASPSQAADAVSQPTEAQVQSPATDDPGGLADIVVTAERRETSLQQTPIAITAVTSGALEAQGIRNLNDLAASVPNLTATTGPQGSADANFFVRGVGQFDFIATNDPGVGVYVDGVYLGRTVGALIDASNVERVEVLRGPQGTLFGRNTLGGAVSVTTKAPDLGELRSYIRGTGGSRQRFEIDGSVNLPLGDIAALRLSGFARKQDGWARRVFDGAKFGRTQRYGGQAALVIQPATGLTIDLKADYSNDKSNLAPSVLRAFVPLPFFPADIGADIQRPGAFNRIFASNSPRSRNEIYGFSGTVAYDLGGATLKSITAYRKLDAFSTSDPDGTGYRLYDQLVPTNQDQFSQELQLTGEGLGGRLEYVAGLYYFNERVRQTLDLCFAPITPTPTARFNACNIWSQGNDQTTNSYAAFGQLRFSVSDALSFTLGGRYTEERKRNTSTQFFDFRPAGFSPAPGVIVPGFVAPIVTDLRGRLKFEKFTPKVGAELKPNDRLLIFASYAEGFRSGGFNGRLVVPAPAIPTYRPDTNETFELGFKSDFLDRRLRFNVTGFYSKYKGIQQTISDPVVQFRVANAGRAELYGFEAELTALPTEGLLFNAALGFTESSFERAGGQTGPVDPTTGISFGNRLPFSPKWTASVGAEYAFDLGANGKITPRGDLRYQSRTFFSPFNLPFEEQGKYALLSARLTYVDEGDRFSVAVFGDNLTNKRFYTFGQNALGAQGVAYNYIGRPREYGVTGSIKF